MEVPTANHLNLLLIAALGTLAGGVLTHYGRLHDAPSTADPIPSLPIVQFAPENLRSSSMSVASAGPQAMATRPGLIKGQGPVTSDRPKLETPRDVASPQEIEPARFDVVVSEPKVIPPMKGKTPSSVAEQEADPEQTGDLPAPTVDFPTVDFMVPEGEFSAWLPSDEYSLLFERMHSLGMRPVMVEGKLDDGENFFRGAFASFDRGTLWVTHHGVTDQFYSRLCDRFRRQGFVETWHQIFRDSSGSTMHSTVWEKQEHASRTGQ